MVNQEKKVIKPIKDKEEPVKEGGRVRFGKIGFAPDKEFEQKIIDMARVARVMAGGKRLRFRACVAVGNKKGKVGMGVAKGADVTLAVNKAVAQAKKRLINIVMEKETIPHEIREKFGAAIILLKPAPAGTGIKAGGAMRIILELGGVKNAVGKILGSKNKINNVRATINALSNLKPRKNHKKETEEIKEAQ